MLRIQEFMKISRLFMFFSATIALTRAVHPMMKDFQAQSHHNHFHSVENSTIAGAVQGCNTRTEYFINPHVKFPMCIGQTGQDLKNGASIINLIGSRGYLPTCRVMQLMLWMSATVSHRGSMKTDYFIDIGANIGSCSVHMAAMGYPVISVEPVQQHVDTIRGSIEINPTFHIDLQHIGMSHLEKHIRANFGHGARNWGASEFHEVAENASFEAELRLKSMDQVIGNRRVSLVKIDCEGCEWEAIKGGKRSLSRIPMMKIELVQQSYTAGNETMYAKDILLYLQESGFDLYIDHWNEQKLYFGNHGKEIMDIDRTFGSARHNLGSDMGHLHKSAVKILSNPINVETYNQKEFLKSFTDVIVIEKSLSAKMKRYWLKESSSDSGTMSSDSGRVR